MDKSTKENLIGQSLLLIATLAWGTSFVVLKQTINALPAMFVVSIRFLACGLIGCLIFLKKIIKLNKKTLVRGVILGAILASAYLSQTYGLKFTTPGSNAFLTSSYCVMCPLLLWAIRKVKPESHHLVSAILCVIGIGFIALFGENAQGSNSLLGNFLTLVSAVFFGLQIIFIDSFCTKDTDPIQLLTIELFTVGLILFAFSMAVELPIQGKGAFVIDFPNLFNIIYLTLACTLLPQSAQMFGQKLSKSPSQSAIILSLEAVFGALFSVLLQYEQLTLPIGIGFGIIFIAILICELKIDLLAPFRKRLNSKEKQ